jgi:hypothetical protein
MLFPVVACCGLEFFRVSGRSSGGSRGAPASYHPGSHGNASNFSIEILRRKKEKEEEEGGRKKKRKDSPPTSQSCIRHYFQQCDVIS